MKKYCLLVIATMVALASCGGIRQGIKGKLVDAVFGDPVKNIQVKLINIDGTATKAITLVVKNDDGEFQQSLEPGRYRIELEDTAEDFKYGRQVNPFTIEEGKALEITYKMDPIVKQWIHGKVMEKETKKPVADATIKFGSTTCKTDKNGDYSLKNFRSGTINLEITAKGYAPMVKDYKMSEGESIEDFELTPTGYIEGAKVNLLNDLMSYVFEVSNGTDEESITSVDSIIRCVAPLELNITQGDQQFVAAKGKFFKNTNEKWVQTNQQDFEKLTETPYTIAFKRFQSAFEQFNKLKKTISTDVENIESANLVNYKFQATFEDTTYECNLWLYFDGNFMGYPTKLIMKSSGKYYEYSFSKFNSPENRINPPEIK